MMKLYLTITAVTAATVQDGACTYTVAVSKETCKRVSKTKCEEKLTITKVDRTIATASCTPVGYAPPGKDKQECKCSTEVNGFATYSDKVACGYEYSGFGECAKHGDECLKTQKITKQGSEYQAVLGTNCYPVGTAGGSSVTPFLNETCDCSEAEANKKAALAKNGASCNEDKECASSLCGITNGTCMQGEADNRAGSEGCLYEFSTWGKCEKKGKNCTRERAILKWSADWSLYKSGKNCQSPPKGKFTAPHPTLGTKPCEICTAAAPTAPPTATTTQKPAAPKVTYTEKKCQESKPYCGRKDFATFTTACKAVCETHAAWCTKFKEYCENPAFTDFRNNKCKVVCVEGQ